MRRALLMVVLVAGTLVVAVGVPALPAGASCAGDPNLAAAMAGGHTVFVGTVVSTTNRGRWATFAVEEMWNGDLGDTVVVKGGPAPTGDPTRFSATSVDRSYQPGSRYLVDAAAGAMPWAQDMDLRDGDLVDNACSATTLWNDNLATQRPGTAKVVARDQPIEIKGELPDPAPASHRSPWAVAAAVAAFALIVGVVLWLLFRRGSIADRARTDLPDPDAPEGDGAEARPARDPGA